MSFIQNLFTSRDNNANGASYVGQQDRIWWNPDTNAFYYSNGNTPGGIPIGAGGAGSPGGPVSSIQYNLGGGTFGGTANLVIDGAGLSAVGNITAAWFIGNVSTTGNITGGNILTNNYLYANGQSIFANIQLTGNIDLGNLYITDQTIYGKNLNANIGLSPEGDGWVVVPKIDISGMTVANTGTAVQFDTDAGIDLQFGPGTGGNILTAGTIKPTSNNLAGLGAVGSRYTDLWLGSGNINIIDQTLNQNQQIYANQGNLIIGNASGLTFGNFRFYGNVMALGNAAANIQIGTANATGYVNFNRSIAVIPSGNVGAAKVFEVARDGRTKIYASDPIPLSDAAFQVIGSSSGNSQPRNFTGTMMQVTGQDDATNRITFDAFGVAGSTNAYNVLASRVARGTVDSPQPIQSNDILFRLSSQGWTGNNAYASGVARLSFGAAEAFASNAAVGTYANIQLVPVGSNVIKTVTGFSGSGINFPNAISGGTGNLGITFQDGTFQNTAYLPSGVVSSLTAGAGISLSGPTGDITVTNTGILGVIGTPNRVTVASNVGGVVTLTTPQDLNTTANMTLYSLTVTNLSVTGNVSNVIPSIIDGPVVFVANTATVYNDINTSGLITGNIANSTSAGILYKTATNTWNFDYGNSWGITANTVYGNSSFINNFAHVGYANATVEYGNATIQADSSVDNFSQIVQQNHFQGANASSDFVAVANNGDESNFYIDLGINSNVYNNADYAVTKANDGYLYVNGGNLVIGTQTASRVINLFTGGTSNTQNFIRGTVSDTGLSMVGNVTANNLTGNTLFSTDGISAAGNIAGTNLSVTGIVTGSSITGSVVSATGTVTGGNLRTSGTISATGNIITAANLVTATTVINSGVSTSGTVTAANINGANITASGTISAIGNISTPNLNASIAIVSTLLSITGNIDGGNLRTSGIISTTGNATFGNVQTTGRVSVTGNIDGGNIRTAGIITATGNISTAGFFIGDGGFISNITTAVPTKIVNGTSWANIAASGGNLVIAIAGNTVQTISAGGANITGYANVSGNITGGNLAVSGISNLNSNANVKITGGSTGQLLSTDGAGNLFWISSGNIAPTSGTWTPTLVPETGSYTLTINNTFYQKIGGVAFCTFDITIASVSTPNGNVIMGNLPFTSASTAATTGSLAVSFYTGMNSPTNVVSGTVPGSANTVTMYWQGSSDTKMDPLTHNRLKATTRLVGSVYYATV